MTPGVRFALIFLRYAIPAILIYHGVRWLLYSAFMLLSEHSR